MLRLTKSRLPNGLRFHGRTALRCHSTVPEAETSDIVIVGGGPAGLALASTLGSSRLIQDTLKITLIEASDLSKIQEWSLAPGLYSNRVSSITNASQAFLKNIGVWSQVAVDRTRPIEEMEVWDGVSDARISFSASETKMSLVDTGENSEMARMTENLNLQRALLRHLSNLPAVNIIDKMKVQSIYREEGERGGWPLVRLADGRVLRARLLVGADGPNSPVRAYAGIQSYGWAYDTHAVVATLFHHPRSPLQAPNTVAYQRFLPTGPIAFLPLSPTASSLVWSTKPALARALVQSDPVMLANMINAAFCLPEVSIRYLHNRILNALEQGAPISLQELQEEIRWREESHSIDSHSAYSISGQSSASAVGVPPHDADAVPPFVTSVQPGTVASFPLRFSHADAYIGEGAGARAVLVGDAAHTIHPLAGQGLNMGLADVECLARCIEKSVLHGGDVGSQTALLPYARERYFENHKIMAAVDKLHKLFSTTSEPVVWARSVGLEVLNELDTFKAAIMMSAGSSPTFARNPASLAANGIENLARSVGSAQTVLDNALPVLRAGIQELLQQAAKATKGRP